MMNLRTTCHAVYFSPLVTRLLVVGQFQEVVHVAVSNLRVISHNLSPGLRIG